MDDPMFDACRDGRVDEVRRLLDAGEDVNGVYISGLTHVMMALDWGQLVVVRLLHARGADLSRVDRDGCNVLHHAAGRSNVDCIEWVLAITTIDVNSTDNYGLAPIMVTIYNHLMAFKLLIERGANLFMKNKNGRRAIDRPLGPQVLQHAKPLLWESVKPLLLLTKAIAIAADDDSNPSPVLPSVIKVFGISGIVRDYIAPYLMRKGLIIRVRSYLDLLRNLMKSRGG
jgi:hypothetical protein